MNGSNISTKGMSRDEWVSLRRSYLGASDASAVLGMNPWKSPVDVFLEKTGRATNNADSIDMWLGREIEPVIAKLFEQESGMKCRQDFKIRCHPKYDYLRTNLDRVVQSAPLEMKMMAKYTDIPPHYYTQIMFQAMVTDAPHVYFAVLSTSTPRSFYWHKFMRDDDLIEEMRSECVNFWETYITGDEIPDPLTARDAKGLYPDPDPESTHEADRDARNDVEMIADIVGKIKEKQSEVDELKASVMNKMKESEVLTWHGLPIATWRKTKDGKRFDMRSFQAEHPKLHKKYLINKPGYRRFNTKGEML